MNPVAPVNYHTVILFAQKDETYKKDLERHLNFIAGHDKIGNFKCQCLESSEKKSLSPNYLIEKNIVIVCLVSYHLILSGTGFVDHLELLIKAHKLKRIQLIPVILDDCDFQHTSFKNVSLLRANKIPVHHIPEKNYMHTWRLISEEIAACIKATFTYHKQVERAWNVAASENSINSYFAFFKEHPYSQFSSEAMSRYDHLIEEKLWKEAQFFDDIPHYLHYLKNTPLEKYKNETVEKIIELENSEDVARQDVVENDNMGMFLKYKLNFREMGDIGIVDQRIINLMERSIDEWIYRSGEINTRSNYLNYEVYKSCDEKEVFTFELFEKFVDDLARGIQFLIEKTNKLIQTLRLYVFYILPGGLLAGILTELILFGRNFLFQLPKGWLNVLLFVLFIVYFSYRVMRAFRSIRKDLFLFQEKFEELRKNWVELKISFLTYDIKVQGRVIFFMYKTEDWLQENKEKNLVNYLFDFKRIESAHQKKLKAVESRINQLSVS